MTQRHVKDESRVMGFMKCPGLELARRVARVVQESTVTTKDVLLIVERLPSLARASKWLSLIDRRVAAREVGRAQPRTRSFPLPHYSKRRSKDPTPKHGNRRKPPEARNATH